MKWNSRWSMPLFVALLATHVSAENRLFIDDQTLAPSQTDARIPIRLDNDQALYGYSLSLKTDPAVLELKSLDLAGTLAAGAEFSSGQVHDGGAHLSWGVVLTVAAFDPLKVIAAGAGLEIGILVVDVSAAGAASTEVRFEDVLSPDPQQTPDAKNVLVSDQGTRVAVATAAGTIDIQGQGGATFIRGNSNGDGSVDISDAIYHLGFLFLGGPAPPCFDASDADDNGTLEITDAIFLLSFLFQGGQPIKLPFPDPGADPTADALECAG